MQHTPIVEDDGATGLQLDGDQELRRREDGRPGLGGTVPVLHGAMVGESRVGHPVGVVPADLSQIGRVRFGVRVVRQDRVAWRGGDIEEGADGGTLGAEDDRMRRQRPVEIGGRGIQVRSGSEAVREGGFASLARQRVGFGTGVREEMEELEASRVGEVGRVRVQVEWQSGVRRVNRVHLGGEVPEAAVVGGADVRDAFDEGLRCFRSRRRGGDKREAVCLDLREKGFEARRVGLVHDGAKGNGRVGF